MSNNDNQESDQESDQETEIWERFGNQGSDQEAEIWREHFENKINQFKLTENELQRDHSRKYWALIALIFGFFLSVCLDLLISNDRWITGKFSASIVPILAFILGTNINNNK